MIKISNLYKTFNEGKPNEFCALKNVNLGIGAGETLILKGVSGSGKSTLLSIIGALSKPSSGEVLVGGRNISKLPDAAASDFRHSQIGFIFQAFNLLEALSVKQNIIAPLTLLNLSGRELDARAQNAMELANIAHKKDQIASKLSGGEKQRCAIARALVTDAPIILADEPTANLDRQNSLAFIEILRRFKELKKTVIVATHDVLFDELSFVDRYENIAGGEIA
ncbi:MAG: ABC transporter ATP-binding protein [Campylobacter sp.]